MKIKATFYMKSGNVITLKFTEIEISKLSGTKGKRNLDYKNASKSFTIDIDEIECVTFKKVLF